MRQDSDHQRLARTIEGALIHSARVLSQFVASACSPTESKVVMRTMSELPSALGDADEPMTCILLTLGRDLHGFLALMLPMGAVDALAPLLLQGGGNLELRKSAFGELGNVVGSAFLNFLADELNLTVMPSPPQVVHDMAGAVLGTLAAHLAMQGYPEFPVIQTTFRGVCEGFGAYLLWLPGELQVLGERA